MYDFCDMGSLSGTCMALTPLCGCLGWGITLELWGRVLSVVLTTFELPEPGTEAACGKAQPSRVPALSACGGKTHTVGLVLTVGKGPLFGVPAQQRAANSTLCAGVQSVE